MKNGLYTEKELMAEAERTEYEIKRLQALLEGLECNDVEGLIADATPDDLRRLGKEASTICRYWCEMYAEKSLEYARGILLHNNRSRNAESND